MIQIIFLNIMAFLLLILINLNEKRAFLIALALYLIISIIFLNFINIFHLIKIINAQILIMQNIQLLKNFFYHLFDILKLNTLNLARKKLARFVIKQNNT